MSDLFESSPSPDRFASFRAMLNRWGFLRKPALAVAGSGYISVTFAGRRPGVTLPVATEISPAMVDPFPEPRTIPGGWDMSELVKG